MIFGPAVQPPEQQQPQEAEQARDDERGPPAAERVIRPQHDERRERAADRRAAVEQRDRPSAVAPREPLGDGLGRAGPVRRLRRARAGSGSPRGSGSRSPATSASPRPNRTRPRGSGRCACRCLSRRRPDARLAERVGDAEGDDQPGEVGVRPVVLGLDVRREHAQRLPVDVVDDRRQEQQAADVPAEVLDAVISRFIRGFRSETDAATVRSRIRRLSKRHMESRVLARKASWPGSRCPGSRMPAYPSLSPVDLENVVAYLPGPCGPRGGCHDIDDSCPRRRDRAGGVC